MHASDGVCLHFSKIAWPNCVCRAVPWAGCSRFGWLLDGKRREREREYISLLFASLYSAEVRQPPMIGSYNALSAQTVRRTSHTDPYTGLENRFLAKFRDAPESGDLIDWVDTVLGVQGLNSQGSRRKWEEERFPLRTLLLHQKSIWKPVSSASKTHKIVWICTSH